MGFLKNQLLKVIEWEDTTQDTIAYKYPIPAKAEIMNGSKLIVREGQVAILLSKGKIADIYEPGRHSLDTGNMPVLTALNAWPYGFKSSFVCDVIFVNTKQFIAHKWGTSTPVMMRDQDFGMVQFRCYGLYTFKVEDPQVFLKELMGSGLSYQTSAVEEQLKRMIVSGITESVAASNIPALDLAMRLNDLASNATTIVETNFFKMGIKLVTLTIENISLSEESKKAMDARTRMNILGSSKEYTAFTAADAMKTMAENAHKGNMGNLGGIGLGLGTGTTMAGLYSSTIAAAQNANNSNDETKEALEKMKKEAEVAKAEAVKARQESQQAKIEASKQKTNGDTAFAGAVFDSDADAVVCSRCGKDNKANARFCSSCGNKLVNTCPKCGTVVASNMKFCPECGTKMAQERKCKECGRVAKPNEKFCASCGCKLDT